MDFISDTLVDGLRIRVFNVVDDLSREAVTMEVDTSLPSRRVIRALDRAFEERGKPHRILMDNGPNSPAMKWMPGLTNAELHFITPGKPTENATVESFNARVRDECLNQHCFRSVQEAEAIIEDWRIDYNTIREHGSLNKFTPREFAETLEEGYPSSKLGQAEACQTSTQLHPIRWTENVQFDLARVWGAHRWQPFRL